MSLARPVTFIYSPIVFEEIVMSCLSEFLQSATPIVLVGTARPKPNTDQNIVIYFQDKTLCNLDGIRQLMIMLVTIMSLLLVIVSLQIIFFKWSSDYYSTRAIDDVQIESFSSKLWN